MISVLIYTRNEERDLPGCLASVAWSDDIHVLDSFSTDRTVEIARAAGVAVTLPRAAAQEGGAVFGGDEAARKNWALANLPFRNAWVLHLDADERVTPELRDALLAAVKNPGPNVAFRVQRRDFFLGTWLRHVQTSPYYLRLFRPEKMHYERLVNPVSIPDGPAGEVTGYLDHFPFSKGIAHWVERHNAYSTLEARQILENRAAHKPFSLRLAFTAGGFNERRFHQKELFYRLPARPLVKFLLLYVLRRGFLDGRAGFTYAMLQSFYEYLIVLKTRELTSLARRAISAQTPIAK
ncbi:MAG: glycosyltransferase family 2 protein [Acidobacteriota bacterium]|nr:glycosyltransferase family 2 protein [Acidobacteriota bacterium]